MPSRPCVFICAFANPDGVTYDVFIPARTDGVGIVSINTVPVNVGGQLVEVQLSQRATILEVIGSLIGAAAGLTGMKVPDFVAQLQVAHHGIVKTRLGDGN